MGQAADDRASYFVFHSEEMGAQMPLVSPPQAQHPPFLEPLHQRVNPTPQQPPLVPPHHDQDVP